MTMFGIPPEAEVTSHETPDKLTWKKIEELSLRDPIIHAAMTYRLQGHLSDEQMLIYCIVMLHGWNCMLRDDVIRLMKTQPFDPELFYKTMKVDKST